MLVEHEGCRYNTRPADNKNNKHKHKILNKFFYIEKYTPPPTDIQPSLGLPDLCSTDSRSSIPYRHQLLHTLTPIDITPTDINPYRYQPPTETIPYRHQPPTDSHINL